MVLHVENLGSLHELVQFANGRASRGFFEMFDPRHLTDEQYVEISDGTTAVQFTIDAGGDGVSAGEPVDTSLVADGDEDALADAFVAAINGHAFNMTATKVTGPSGKSKIELLNTASGANNVPITQGVQGGGLIPYKFATTGLAGGTDGIVTADIIRIINTDADRWILFWKT